MSAYITPAKLIVRIGRQQFRAEWTCQENNDRRFVDYGNPPNLHTPRYAVVNENVVLSLIFRGKDMARVLREVSATLKRASKRKGKT